MAKVVSLQDDLLADGTPAAETVLFALDSIQYEIDLNDENAAILRSYLAKYIRAGRKQTKRKYTKRNDKAESVGIEIFQDNWELSTDEPAEL